jgi:sulfonate transport system substrate-binding protein
VSTRLRPFRSAIPAALLAVVVLVGCSSSASTRAADTTDDTEPAATQVTLPKTVPPGTQLRVGDQLDYLKTILKLAGEDKDFPYDVQYAAFIGGPPMLQAFQGEAIDTGFIGSTPLIFAQAQGQDLRAVAGWANEGGSYGLVTAPGVTDIKGWKDLAGKSPTSAALRVRRRCSRRSTRPASTPMTSPPSMSPRPS